MFKTVKKCLYVKENDSKLNIFLNVLIIIIIFAIFADVLFKVNYSGIYVIGNSMEPTLDDGSYLYVDRNATPDYSDIVVVYKGGGSGTTIIKRVIAMGGDRVYLDHGALYLKKSGETEFSLISEDYVDPDNNDPNYNTFPTVNGQLDTEGYLVEEGCLFLLGDNRNVSADSRQDKGTSYPLTNLYGVATAWSLNNLKLISAIYKYFHFDLPRYFGLSN